MKTFLKTVLVGDGGVGKTSLIMELTNPGSSTSSQYIPTVLDDYQYFQEVNGRQYYVGLWDTAGQESYDRLRPLSFPHTDFFFVCFAVNDPDSFEHVEKFVMEVTHHCPGVPKMLVGLKCELREDEEYLGKYDSNKLVSRAEAMKTVAKYGFIDYMEVSSFLHINVDEVFLTPITYSENPNSFHQNPDSFQQKSKSGCSMM